MRGATRFAPDVCRGLLFQSTLPVRGATFGRRAGDSGAGYFNPRSPCGERRITFLVCCANCCNFNPRSPCGERRLNVQNIHISFLFQSTLPVRGATNFEGCNLRYDKNFNPRSPCGERQGMVVLMRAFTGISIHAPRAGSDENALKNWSTLSSFQSTLPVRGATSKEDKQKMETTISIHAPRAGSDLTGMSDPEKWIRFQSTLPVRGATSFSRAAFAGSCYFNPRSPCGERRGAGRRIRGNRLISIHAPRAGSDIQKLAFLSDSLGFQSTLPVRGATQRQKNRWELFYISIHAPRAGSDDEPRAGRGVPRDFNPRSPCGERLFVRAVNSVRGVISIHAPRAGSDVMEQIFIPRRAKISIHAPRAGSDGIGLK